MDKASAQKLVEKYQYLEGRSYKDKTITCILAIPSDKKALRSIVDAIDNDLRLQIINEAFDDFIVVGILNFDDYHLTRYLDLVSLEDILSTL